MPYHSPQPSKSHSPTRFYSNIYLFFLLSLWNERQNRNLHGNRITWNFIWIRSCCVLFAVMAARCKKWNKCNIAGINNRSLQINIFILLCLLSTRLASHLFKLAVVLHAVFRFQWISILMQFARLLCTASHRIDIYPVSVLLLNVIRLKCER